MNKHFILMIEDNDEDYVATRRAFNKSGYQVNLLRLETAKQAMDFLLLQDDIIKQDKASNLPSLILLDLNLPGIDGKDFLQTLKNHQRLSEVPIIILTTSNNPEDVSFCYRNGANGYQIKEMGFENFSKSIKNMTKYWFETATIPAQVNY